LDLLAFGKPEQEQGGAARDSEVTRMVVASQMRRTRLVIADRHPIVLHGLISVIAAQQDFEIVASCTSGKRSVDALRNLAPDVALLGDSLPDVSASEILAIADAEHLPTRLVFFTASIEQGNLASAIADGACSGISKFASPETLLRSLRQVMDGISLLPEPAPEASPAEKEENGVNVEELLAVLTDREREIMRLVAEGASNKAIARQLNISDGTIKVHLHHIYQKLEISSRTVLAALVLSQRHGGFGMLWLAALTFATMHDAKAMDPDEPILDDDNIEYKDFEHGAFELWTREPVARHIVVDDPGKTVVITTRGSSVSVSHVANSAARMEELQSAQQAVLANASLGYGPGGSSSTPFNLNLPGAQPLNYVQPGGPATQGSLPPLEFAPNPIFYPLLAPAPPPEPPSLNAAAGPILIDTSAFDDFAPSSGNFIASSPRPAATLTFGIAGGVTGSTVVDGSSYDVSRTGIYGTLYLNSTTGAYIYVPDDDAINALAAPSIESFTITVWDGTLAASQTFTVAVNGSNDAAIISGETGGAVTEAGGIANAEQGTLTASGTLTATDVDNPANNFTAVTAPTPSQNGYGSFTMTAAGVWTYTLNNANAEVQALNIGGTLIDTFIVTTVDGTPQVVTITITGSNDAAIISGTTTGSVVETGNAAPGTPVATGTLTDVDVDNAPNSFIAVTSPTASSNGYGSFTMTAAGVWTYTLNNSNAEVQALNVGGTLIDTFIVTTVDGTPQVVTITITGSNDAAIISGTTTGSVVETGTTAPGTPVATGTLTAVDVDNAANAFIAVGAPTASSNGYGSFTLTAGGVWTFTLNNSNPEVQALNVGGTLIDTFTVTTVDGTAQVVTITITGNNDAAIISGTSTGSVVETGTAVSGTPVATGTLTDVDVDNAPNSFIAVSSPTASSNGYGSFTMTAAGVWTYTLNNSNAEVQALNVGGTLIDTFTVTTVDGTAQVVTITITGNNDAAIISGTSTGSVVETGTTAPGTPVATGTLTAVDVDNAANAFVAVSSPTASSNGYGSFTMTAAGVWTYTLNNSNPEVQALNVGGILIDTFTVTTVDGTAQVVTITITGNNDAAIISGTSTGSVVEAGGDDPGTPVATGTLTAIDADDEDNTFIAVTAPAASSKGYGTFMMTAAGVWTYTLNNANAEVEALNPGETLTDTFTVTTIDGTTQVVTIVIHGSGDADPNDFDNLALGTAVVTDPPFVYGTPNGETIAGGGNQFQIVYAGKGNDTVNGTSSGDLLYGGSGNDTMKGNGGDDTIYGGSGRDDINGNNGNDIIIGGYGADTLTGSNGDDVFVYLSVADSNSRGFDRITDFASGSDKINLAAFGALAFMHLASTSTSVPPRTIAWIYNAASNETIVYVNPTDGALDIGDPALLEIHLQGVQSVAESDFIFEESAATAVVASAETVDPMLAAIAAAETVVLASTIAEVTAESTVEVSAHGGGWTPPRTEESFKFDFDRSLESIGSVRIAQFGEASAHATAAADGEAVTTLASGSQVVGGHAPAATATTESTFHPGPLHGNAGISAAGGTFAMASSGANEPAALANANAAAQLAEHGVTPGNGAGPSASEGNGPNNPQSASNSAAAGQGNQHAAASAGHVAEHGQGHSQHSNNASQQTDPVEAASASAASPQGMAHGHGAAHAEIGKEPGQGNSNNAAAASNQADPVTPVNASAASAQGTAHGQGAAHVLLVQEPEPGNSPHSKAAAAASHQADPVEPTNAGTASAPGLAHGAGQAQVVHEPGQAGSFNFSNAVAASNHADPVEPTGAGAASAQGLAHGVGQAQVVQEPGQGSSFQFSNAAVASNLADPVEPTGAGAASAQGLAHGAGQAQVVQQFGQGSSFQFSNAAVASNLADPVEPINAGSAQGMAHGYGAGPVGPEEIQQLVELSQPADPAAAHAHLVPPHAASHGAHELIV
jgi:VCBS repeat-containing protein